MEATAIRCRFTSNKGVTTSSKGHRYERSGRTLRTSLDKHLACRSGEAARSGVAASATSKRSRESLRNECAAFLVFLGPFGGDAEGRQAVRRHCRRHPLDVGSPRSPLEKASISAIISESFFESGADRSSQCWGLVMGGRNQLTGWMGGGPFDW